MGKREASQAAIPSSPELLKRPRATPPTASQRSSRDWSNLGDGPAGLIAELVLAADVADYIRFRAVCRPWRRCSADPRAFDVLDRRFRPRQWIMLWYVPADPRSRRRRFLNVCTGQCIQVELPELVDHRLLLQSATEGLVLLRRANNAVRLLNPLTRQAAELPRIATRLLASGFRGEPPDNAGLADDRTVVLYFCRKETLAFAKPGDDHWVLLKFRDLLMPSMMSFAGRFYCVTSDAVMSVDTGGGRTTPRLVVAAGLPFSTMADHKHTVHLVDNGGELILVRSKSCKLPDDGKYSFGRRYEVYRLDLDAGKMTRVRSLGGRAVFIDRYRALSVSPQVFPYISSDTVCPGFHLIERTWCHKRIGTWNVKDGSIEPPSTSVAQSGLLPHPWSIADLLVAYLKQRIHRDNQAEDIGRHRER